MRFATSPLCPLILLLVAAQSAEAQYLHGRVVDRESGAGLASVSVLVVNPDSSLRAGAVTDRDGHFNLRTSPGTFLLRVRRVGYATTGSVPLELARSDTLSFDIRMAVRPTVLDELTVTAGSRGQRDPSGFFERQTQYVGRFMGPYEVERRRITSPSDLLHDVPGFTVNVRGGGNRVLMSGRNRRCIPTVYVDGRMVNRGTATEHWVEPHQDDGVILETVINANSIRAMEAYQSGVTAPVRFRPVGPIGGGDCGVLVFWTRAGLGR